MPTWESLLREHEGKTLEFKRDLSSPENAMKTVVAFANSAGGTILVGVEDRTRRVRGLSDPEQAEEQFANLVSDLVEPRLVPDIQVLPWRKSHVIAVHVFPGPSRPYFLKTQGPEKGVYVRVGSTNRRADAAQIEEITRSIRGRGFDEEPLPEMSSEAIDFLAASESFRSQRKLKPADLLTLGILASNRGRLVPTVGGLLLFGKDRLGRFPDAYLRAGCFAGTDKTTILDSADIKSHLPAIADEALAFVKRNTRRSITVVDAKNAETWEFPLVAVREAVVNALVHADYGQRGWPVRVAIFSDRIEIDNPGGLPTGLTISDIRQGVSKLRNRVLGRVFHALGLIEQWGSGIQRMTNACLRAGLPEPELEEIGSGFRVTLRRKAAREPLLDQLDQAILDFVRRSPGVSTRQISEQIGRTTRSTRARLGRLVENGLLAAVGTGPQDPHKVFHPSK